MIITEKDCINKTDEQLVSLTLKEQEYYVCLIKRFENNLRNYIMKISSANLQDAEDILQEVFIKAYQNLNDFDFNYKFSNWIFRITHNVTISHYRKKNISSRAISWEENDMDNILQATLNLEQKNIQNLSYENILKIIERLPLKYKEVLILKFIEDKDYKAISDILHKPTGTIATLLNRAKKMLTRELIKEGIEL